MTSDHKPAPGIQNAIMVPHPPLIVPDVGRGQEAQITQTSQAYRKAAAFVADANPDIVIVISPHTTLYGDYFHVSPGVQAAGDLGQFGAGHVRLHVAYDADLARHLEESAKAAGFPAGTDGERAPQLDHATMVPLYFLREAAGGTLPFRVLRVGLSGLSYAMHYRLGQMIARSVLALGRRACVAASGDLSHYLKRSGPYGFRREGPVYDRRIMDIMGRAAFDELLLMPEAACAQAGECGQRSFAIMAGCLDGREVTAQALSYQDVTGVGYGVCLFTPGADDASRQFLAKQEEHT